MEGKGHLNIANQLHAALRKEAFHERLVFIEMNTGQLMEGEGANGLVAKIVENLDSKEGKLTIRAAPAPPAYVIITNNPYFYYPQSAIVRWAGVHGFKIPDIKVTSRFSTVGDMINSRDRHREILDLMESIRDHSQIPSTFDGENPDFAFGEPVPRLIIGNKYFIPVEDGMEIPGLLRFAHVIEEKKSAFCTFERPDGKISLVSFELSEQELAAYKNHPETFFGIYEPRSNRPMRDGIDLYDWFFKCYSATTKEQLLVNMSAYPDIEQLKHLNREDLIKTYCERMVAGFLQHQAAAQPRKDPCEPSDG
jgi:hypothetical protein